MDVYIYPVHDLITGCTISAGLLLFGTPVHDNTYWLLQMSMLLARGRCEALLRIQRQPQPIKHRGRACMQLQHWLAATAGCCH
jgi:hypothetical protein